MINLFGLTLEKLEELVVLDNQNKFRAKQLYKWIYEKEVTSFSLMSDISKKYIEVLNEKYCLDKLEIASKQVSKDGTIKVLARLKDGSTVETVLMRYNYGLAACISSQVGCNMSCAFCASGLLKKKRTECVTEKDIALLAAKVSGIPMIIPPAVRIHCPTLRTSRHCPAVRYR